MELIDLLLKQGILSPEQVDRAKEEAKRTGITLESALEKLGLINQEDIAKVRADALGVPYMDLNDYLIDAELIKLIPENIAKKYRAVPLFKISDTLTLAMADPGNIEALDQIRKVSKIDRVDPVLASDKGIQKILDSYFKSYNNFVMNTQGLLGKKKNQFVSIDFGRAFIKIAYIINQDGKGCRVIKYDSIKTPQPPQDNAAIIDFIKGFLKNNSITAKDAFLTVGSAEKIFIKYLILTAVPEKEMLEAIKWQLKPELGFNVDSAVFDWQVVKDGSICIAAEKNFIDKYLSIIGECGLTAPVISTAAFNYANILNFLPEKSALTAILDIGHKQAALCIYKDNKLIFVRDLSVSSEKLVQSLTGTLVSDKGKITLSLEQAQGLIERFGIPLDETAVLEGNIKGINIISLMRPFLEGMAREIKRSFDYFCSTFKEQAPGVLYLTGGGGSLKNLDIYLNKELKLKVAQLPLSDRIEISAVKEKLNNNPNQIANLVAAALAEEAAVNLLPHEIKTKKRESYQKAFLRFISVIAAAIFLFFFLAFRAEIADYRNRLKAADSHLQAIKEAKVLKRRIELKEGLIHKIKLNRVPAGGLLALISHIIPENIVIEELLLDQQSHILILKGEVLSGTNTAEAELTGFIKNLEASSFFGEATLSSSQNISGIQKFEISCGLNY